MAGEAIPVHPAPVPVRPDLLRPDLLHPDLPVRVKRRTAVAILRRKVLHRPTLKNRRNNHAIRRVVLLRPRTVHPMKSPRLVVVTRPRSHRAVRNRIRETTMPLRNRREVPSRRAGRSQTRLRITCSGRQLASMWKHSVPRLHRRSRTPTMARLSTSTRTRRCAKRSATNHQLTTLPPSESIGQRFTSPTTTTVTPTTGTIISRRSMSAVVIHRLSGG